MIIAGYFADNPDVFRPKYFRYKNTSCEMSSCDIFLWWYSSFGDIPLDLVQFTNIIQYVFPKILFDCILYSVPTIHEGRFTDVSSKRSFSQSLEDFNLNDSQMGNILVIE